MYDEVKVLTHSSVMIKGEMTVYFDPFQIAEETHDADIIFVTHEHYDHYSPEDIAKVKNAASILVCPASMRDSLADSGIDEDHIELVEPWDGLEINSASILAVPAYNVGKQFHPKENRWVGYMVSMGGTSYYVSGDTDIQDDILALRDRHPDVVLLPCGGTYTMTVSEAARLAEALSPKLAVPTHYGSIVGEKTDGENFVRLLEGKIPAETRIKF